MPIVQTSVKTSDASITTAASRVYWVLISAAATGGAWQLNDSTDDSGTDVLSGVVQANGGHFIDLSGAPIQFETGIRADLAGSNQTITVGYTS